MTGYDMPLGPNPYVGPRPFQDGETIYGRDAQVRNLFYLLNAERIVVLHSPSGAGKTSLVNAGLLPMLRREEFDVWPPIRVNLEPPDNQINRYVYSAIVDLEEELPEERRRSFNDLGTMRLAEYVSSRPRRTTAPRNKVLIFDQFEELLTVDPLAMDAKRTFFAQVGELLRNNRDVWALFSLREDYLAPLDPYCELVPTQLKNRFRMDLLSLEEARDAISRPAEAAGRVFDPKASDQLIRDLAALSVQQPDGSFVPQTGQYVEPVQLQVVCRRLWDRMPADKRKVDADDLKQFGQVNEALEQFYEDIVEKIAETGAARERTIRGWFSERLITPSGVRGQVLQGAENTDGLRNDAVFALVSKHLVRAEKRRGATWFELAHDRLIAPVLENNRQWFDASLNDFERRAALWKKEPTDGLFVVGAELLNAEEWIRTTSPDLTQEESAFLANSRKAHATAETERHQTRKIRRLGIFSAVFGVVAFVALIVILSLNTKLADWRKQLADNKKQLADDEEQLAANKKKLAANKKRFVVETGKRNALEGSIRDLEVTKHTAAIALANLYKQRADDTVGQAEPVRAARYYLQAARHFTEIKEEDDYRKTYLSAVDQSHKLVRTLLHDGVNGACFSKLTPHLLTWGRDGTARLWDLESGEELRIFQHSGTTKDVLGRETTFSVAGARLNDDETQVVTWSDDKTARIWHIQQEQEPRIFAHDGPVRGAIFIRNSSRLLTWTANQAYYWNVEHEPSNNARYRFDFKVTGLKESPVLTEDGACVLKWAGDTVQLLDLENESVLKSFILDEEVLRALFSPDETLVFACGKKGTSRLFSVQTGDRLNDLKLPDQPGKEHDQLENKHVIGAVFNDDRSRLLTWEWLGDTHLWDTSSGAHLKMFRNDGVGFSQVLGAAFIDQDRIVTWSADNNARIWRMVPRGEIAPPLTREHRGGYNEGPFLNASGELLLTTESARARLWKLPDVDHDPFSWRESSTTVPAFDNAALLGARFDCSESSLVTWGGGTARIWNVKSREIQRLSHKKAVRGARFIQGDSRVMTWSDDGTASLWSIGNKTPIVTIPPEPGTSPILGATFSSDSRKVLIWQRRLAELYELQTGDRLQVFEHGGINQALSDPDSSVPEMPAKVNDAILSRDELRVVTSGEDYTAKLWDVKSGRVLWTFSHDCPDGGRSSNCGILGAKCNNEQTRVLTWGSDGTARLWDVESGEQLHTFRHKWEKHLTDDREVPITVNGAFFDRTESNVLTWSDDGKARLWHVDTEKSLFSIEHKGGVNGAAFSQNQSRILTWGRDGKARITNVATELSSDFSTFPGSDLKPYIVAASWDGDESRIVTVTDSGAAIVWHVENKKQINTFRHQRGFEDNLNGATFARTKWRPELLTWGGDGTARLWDVNKGEQLALFAHPGTTTKDGKRVPFSVVGASFNQKETHVLTWSDDDTARLWALEDYNIPIERRILELEVRSAATLSDSGEIRTLSSDELQSKKAALAEGDLK